MAKISKDDYSLKDPTPRKRVPAPELPYRPQDPAKLDARIGLIGCGGISAVHLDEYKRAKYKVVALCDVCREAAAERQQEYYPKAAVYTDYRELLDRKDIDVVDITPHPEQRTPIVEAAITRGKHVLSQKPFVSDLKTGQRLVQLAHRHGVKLAVNHNGRWAPHFSYIRQAIKHGIIGDVVAVHCAVHWSHNFIKGTVFDKIRHIILYDFGIHWFDILHCFMGERKAVEVFATSTKSRSQTARQPMLAQANVRYPQGHASLVFDGDAKLGWLDQTFVVGSKGTISSAGPTFNVQKVTLCTEKGQASPRLTGAWYSDGFHGTMGELLCAIEEDREPYNSAASSLGGLALCFAATESTNRGSPIRPGTVDRIGE
jgi:predicted dehydrogenase